MKTIQALKIDVSAQTVTLIEIPESDSLETLQQLIDCQTITGFDIDSIYNGHFCYVDDEALFSTPEGYFTLPGFTHPIAGNAVITGTNLTTGENDSVKPDLPEKIKSTITFFTPLQIQLLYQKR